MEAFEWVKASAGRHRVYLKHFMRADDAANPAGWPDLLGRIEAAAGSGPLSRQHASELEALSERLKRIRAGEDSEEEWRTVIQMVDHLVRDGVPPSNRELRDALLGVLEDLPERDDLPDGCRRVLIEIDRYLATAIGDGQTVGFACSGGGSGGGRTTAPGAKRGADRGDAAQGTSGRFAAGARAFRVDLDRDQGAPVDRFIRADDCEGGSGGGVAGDSVVEPCVRRCAANSATGTTSRWCDCPGAIARTRSLPRSWRNAAGNFRGQVESLFLNDTSG